MSTTKLADIQAQISKLEAEAATLRAAAEAERQKQLSAVIQELRSKIAEYGLSASDLGLSTRAGSKAKRKSGPKAPAIESGILYRSPTGETWTSGTRGRKPRWLTEALADGKQLADFAAS